jgi:catechol 2,3-dioxygenase-like lactoylglutathione lyase family enzyme
MRSPSFPPKTSSARAFYRDQLGLEPIEEREGGLRYCCAAGEFHVFLPSGRASGASTQLGFEVEDIDATVAELRDVAASSSDSMRPASR